jgi:hypothetical protein
MKPSLRQFEKVASGHAPLARSFCRPDAPYPPYDSRKVAGESGNFGLSVQSIGASAWQRRAAVGAAPVSTLSGLN